MKKNAVGKTARFDAVRRSRCPSLSLSLSYISTSFTSSRGNIDFAASAARSVVLDFAWLFVHHRLSSVTPTPPISFAHLFHRFVLVIIRAASPITCFPPCYNILTIFHDREAYLDQLSAITKYRETCVC